MKGGSKYQPLQDYLRQSNQLQVTLTFAAIEAVMGSALPESARSNRAWWSNRSKGALQASAWMGAGYLAQDLNLEGEHITFSKPPAVYKVERVGDRLHWNGNLIRALRQHMGVTQAELANEMGLRQQTISEWEKGLYIPSRSSAKHLTIVAEKANFRYEAGEG